MILGALFWEQRCLIEMLAQPITDGPHETPNLVKRGIPFISVEAVMNNRLDFTRKRGFISSEYNDQCNKKYKPQLHDVYLVKSGSTVGKVAIVETNMVFNIWSPLAAMRVNEFNNAYFLYYLLQTDNLQDQIKKKSKGGTQPNLSMRILEKCITNSTNLKEETQIALILNKVDKLLLLQQRKLKQLILFKKGILQRIFKSSSVTQDILRLKEDSIQWKKERLRDIAKFLNGRAFKQKELLAKGKYPVVRVGNFYTNDKWYYSNLLLEDNKYLDKGDLLYTWSATFGPHIWTGNKAIFHYHIWKIDFDKKQINKVFLYYFLEADKTQLLANTNGSTMIHMTKSDMENKVIYLPPVSIQTELGQMLSKLDNQIQRRKLKIKLLTELKQFLLQNMFI